MNEIGLSMKSSGFFTRFIDVRSFVSMICPKTIPRMIGTMGKFSLLKINPTTPKAAATAQSVAELRSE